MTELDMLLQTTPETLPIALQPQAIRELQDEVMRLRRELEDCQEDLRDHKEERLRLRGEVHRLTNRSAFEAGVQAGREQVISYLGLQAAVFAVNVEQMQKNIRTMQFPEDK